MDGDRDVNVERNRELDVDTDTYADVDADEGIYGGRNLGGDKVINGGEDGFGDEYWTHKYKQSGVICRDLARRGAYMIAPGGL